MVYHKEELCVLYDRIVQGLNEASKPLTQRRAKKYSLRPGWNEYVDELHQQAREAFKNWVIAGKSRHGPECEIKKKAVARFKYAVRYIKRNELTLRANALARKMQQNDVNDFWNEVKIMNYSKIPLPSIMEGVSAV